MSWTLWGQDKETAIPESNALDPEVHMREAWLEMVGHPYCFPVGFGHNQHS